MDFATRFNLEFATGLAGPVRYRIELTSPVGPSTGGGKQAIQHIRLLPQDGSSAIVIGSWNQVGKSVELRTTDHVRDIHAQRFKDTPFPIDPAAYQELLSRLQLFFVKSEHTVKLLDAVETSMEEPSRGVSGRLVVALVVAAIVIASTVGALVMR